MQSAQFQIVAVVKFFVFGLENDRPHFNFYFVSFPWRRGGGGGGEGKGGGRGERGGKGDGLERCLSSCEPSAR